MQALIRPLKLLAGLIFVAGLAVCLVSTSARVIITAPGLYDYAFEHYQANSRTGISSADLQRVGRAFVDYFNGARPDLQMQVAIRGQKRDLFNDRELLHMEDVKTLVQGVFRIQELSLAYLLLYLGLGLLLGRGRFVPYLQRWLLRGALAVIAALLVLGLAMLVGFQALFLQFHLLSFSNLLWMLDPATDYLLMLFPEAFFRDAALMIAGGTLLEASLLGGGAWWWGKASTSRAIARASSGKV